MNEQRATDCPRESLKSFLRSGTPAPAVLPNSEATLQMLANSGATFSTATLPGLFQAYVHRANSHYRGAFDHQAEIAAAHQHPKLRELLIEVLHLAATMETVNGICRDLLEELARDPDRARENVKQAGTYAWCAADRADRMAWAIGRLAGQLGPAQSGQTSRSEQ